MEIAVINFFGFDFARFQRDPEKRELRVHAGPS